MINRDNWQDVNEYIAQQTKNGKDEQTVLRIQGMMWHLLEWADAKPFGQARIIDPAFPTYLLTARNDGKKKQLSAVSMKKTCEYTRLFFKFIREEHPMKYKQISASWIDTIRPAASKGLQSEFHEHQFYSVEMVRKIAELTPRNLREERDQAAVCFLFLSAMRAQAFVSMQIRCVDLTRLRISQFPEMGVLTKGRKAARTQMLRIPDLLAVVKAWDAKMKAAGLEGEDLWYPALDCWNRNIGRRRDLNWLSRRTTLGKGLRELCQLAGIPYLSSHKLRHGHIYYMMKRVRDMKQLKTLSQNVMHSSVAITDGIYGKMVSDDIADTYEEFAEEDTPTGARSA